MVLLTHLCGELKNQTYMKKLLVLLMLCFYISVTAQDKVRLQNFSMAVNVESLEELEALDMDEIASIFKDIKDYEDVSFELSCEFDQDVENGTLNLTNFKVKGTMDDMDTFLDRLKKCKNVIRKLYKL
jgi:hypothetical protein